MENNASEHVILSEAKNLMLEQCHNLEGIASSAKALLAMFTRSATLRPDSSSPLFAPDRIRKKFR